MHTVKFEYKLLDQVTIKEIERPGVVDSMILDANGKQYRVVYWHDGARKNAWVYDWEIERAKNDSS